MSSLKSTPRPFPMLFQVKLQCDDGVFEDETLVCTGFTASDGCRGRRYVECFAMPVKGIELSGKETADHRFISPWVLGDLKPANLLLRILFHMGAQGFGYQLRSQADSQNYLFRVDESAQNLAGYPNGL